MKSNDITIALIALLFTLPSTHADDKPPVTAKTVTNSIGMKLNRIRAGRFPMGSSLIASPKTPEYPEHLVRISRDYYIGVTEVTQGQWEAVMGTRPWTGEDHIKTGPNYPATYVSWENATAFCQRLSKREKEDYRLPTEAEWEYACRTGTKTTKYNFGDDVSALKEYAWFKVNAYDVGQMYAHQVGLKRPNAWGLYDMHGNVDEWCLDWFGEYENGAIVDPTGPAKGSLRVYRGGSWSRAARYSESASRLRSKPASNFYFLGFRVVRLTRDGR
ncbi:MAG: formylglycine-generating enzyme family protein [Pirellulaceae bacterium]